MPQIGWLQFICLLSIVVSVQILLQRSSLSPSLSLPSSPQDGTAQSDNFDVSRPPGLAVLPSVRTVPAPREHIAEAARIADLQAAKCERIRSTHNTIDNTAAYNELTDLIKAKPPATDPQLGGYDTVKISWNDADEKYEVALARSENLQKPMQLLDVTGTFGRSGNWFKQCLMSVMEGLMCNAVVRCGQLSLKKDWNVYGISLIDARDAYRGLVHRKHASSIRRRCRTAQFSRANNAHFSKPPEEDWPAYGEMLPLAGRAVMGYLGASEPGVVFGKQCSADQTNASLIVAHLRGGDIFDRSQLTSRQVVVRTKGQPPLKFFSAALCPHARAVVYAQDLGNPVAEALRQLALLRRNGSMEVRVGAEMTGVYHDLLCAAHVVMGRSTMTSLLGASWNLQRLVLPDPCSLDPPWMRLAVPAAVKWQLPVSNYSVFDAWRKSEAQWREMLSGGELESGLAQPCAVTLADAKRMHAQRAFWREDERESAMTAKLRRRKRRRARERKGEDEKEEDTTAQKEEEPTRSGSEKMSTHEGKTVLKSKAEVMREVSRRRALGESRESIHAALAALGVKLRFRGGRRKKAGPAHPEHDVSNRDTQGLTDPLPPSNSSNVSLFTAGVSPWELEVPVRAFPERAAFECEAARDSRRVGRRGMLFVKVPKCASSTGAGVALRIARRRGTAEQCYADADHGWASRKAFRRRDRRRSVLWTFVRDPAARAVSMIFHFRVSRGGNEPTDKYILGQLRYAPGGSGDGGFMARYVSTSTVPASFWTAEQPQRVQNPARLQRWVREILSEYDFVGVVERMDESLVALRLLLRLNISDIAYVSAKQHGGFDDLCRRIVPSFVSESTRTFLASDEWRARQAADYTLYAAANQSLDATIERIGRARFDKAMAEHRRMLRLVAEAECAETAVFPCSATGKRQRRAAAKDCYMNDSGCGRRCLDRVAASVDP